MVIFIKEQGSQVQVGTHAALRKVSGKSCLTSSSDPRFTRGKLYVKILIICHFSTGTATIKTGAAAYEQMFVSDLEMGPTVRLEMIQIK